MRTLPSIVVCLTAASGTGSAWAIEVPVACQANAYVERAFQSGYNQGASYVGQVFASVNHDCERLDSVGELLTQSVRAQAPTSSNAFLLCRYSGLVAGVLDGLDNTWTACDADCCLEGRTVGRIAGETYCQVSILLEGLSAPDEFLHHRHPANGRCQEASQECCNAEFIEASLEYVGQSWDGSPVQCSVYTVDPWASVWEDTRSFTCDLFPMQ